MTVLKSALHPKRIDTCGIVSNFLKLPGKIAAAVAESLGRSSAVDRLLGTFVSVGFLYLAIWVQRVVRLGRAQVCFCQRLLHPDKRVLGTADCQRDF